MPEPALPTPRTASYAALGPEDGPVPSGWVEFPGSGPLALTEDADG